MAIYVLGAYGTNNIGDDAILEGIKTIYPNVIPISHGFCKYNPIHLSAAYENKIFKAGDTLILGGGGLFYSIEAINHWFMLCDLASRSGAEVEIRSVGFEGYLPEFYDLTKKLLSLAKVITTRTKFSTWSVNTIFDTNAIFEPDFATKIKIDNENTIRDKNQRKKIGLVLGGDLNSDYSKIIDMVSSYRNLDFIHIPHSRSQLSWKNNDVIVGEFIKSSLYKGGVEEINNFVQLDHLLDPKEHIERFRNLHGVISQRFHGVVFSGMINVPCAVIPPFTLKAKTSIEYNPNASLLCHEEIGLFLDKILLN